MMRSGHTCRGQRVWLRPGRLAVERKPERGGRDRRKTGLAPTRPCLAASASAPAKSEETNGPAPIEREGEVEAGRIQVGSRQCDLWTVPCRAPSRASVASAIWHLDGVACRLRGPGRYDRGRRRRKERGARRDAEDMEEDRRRASPPWASGPTTERQWNPNPRPPCRFFALLLP